jgi:hypothetical protein
MRSVHEDLYTFMISRSLLLSLSTVSDKKNVEKIKTYLMFHNFFLKNHAFYEIMWKNIVEPDRPQMTV